jgi:hypothetical protein
MPHDSGLPKFSHAAQQGERGVNVVSSIFFDQYGWLFKRNHQEHDFGIDGQIEVVSGGGEVTGQLLAVQIKFGKSFFQEKTALGYIYRGEGKHFNYLANYPVPVLVVICHPESRRCYWSRFDPTQTQPVGDGWKMTIPFGSDLAQDKTAIEALLPPFEDHRAALEEYWAVNNLLAESGYIHFVIDKSEILARDTSRPRDFFDRLRSTKELALSCQGKVEISFYGYEQDPRELFEIPEARVYMPLLERALPELFFFVRAQQPTHTLRVVALCQTKVTWPYGRSTRRVGKQLVYDTAEVASFLDRGYAGLNEVTDWLGLPIEENRRISHEVAECLIGHAVPDDEA